jgi:hypothetical protein
MKWISIAFIIKIIWVCIFIQHYLVLCRIRENMYKNKVGIFNYFLQQKFPHRRKKTYYGAIFLDIP